MKIGAFLAGVSAFCAVAGAPAFAQDKPFAGVTVNVITQTGAIQEPLQRRAPEFEALTGAKINVIAVPFSDLYQKILTDWASGTNSVDAAVFAPQWMVDYIAGGYLEDLTPRIEADKDIKQDDVGAFFRDFSAEVRRQDLHDHARWRLPHDVLPQGRAGRRRPEGADDVGRISRGRQGRARPGHERRRHAGLRLLHRQEAQRPELLVRHRRGRLDDPVQGHQPGHVLQHQGHDPAGQQRRLPQVARFPSESTKYGPPDELNLDVSDTRPLFASGRCALNLDWGDVGTISIDPKQSKVMGKWGAAIMPGSKEVLNWDTGKLEACTPETCPHAIDGVNHAPFAAFGGWGGGINAAADPKVKDAAYAYFSFMTQPAQSNSDVTIGGTGFNPYRTSQLTYSDLWKNAGMTEDEAKVYLGAINESMSSPNMILDLRIPQNQKYQQVVLDEAVSRFLAGEIDKEATVKAVEDGWNELNDEIGKDEQLELYKATIGAK